MKKHLILKQFLETVLLNENVTVSQFLKTPNNKEKVLLVKQKIFPIIKEKFSNLNSNLIDRITNWFTKEFIIQDNNIQFVEPIMNNWFQNIADWIASNIGNATIQSQLNSVDFTYAKAIEASQAWHEKLAAKSELIKSKKGAEGRAVVDLSDVPGFEGWKWVSLDKKTCEREGETMGHCGNSAGHNGDNILSLRDPHDIPHLTFINNKGVLGEMKGRGNSKPSEKYHPAIIKLLLSNHIGTIEGGGYSPQNNFSLRDLTPEQQKMLLDKKPYLSNPGGFRENREKLLKKEKEKFFNDKFKQAVKNPKDMDSIMDGIVSSKELEFWGESGKENTRLKVFSDVLNNVYKVSKQNENPDLFFRWMDKVITSTIKAFIKTDLQNYKENPNYFIHRSLIIMLDKLIMQLYAKQPEILRAAPKRNRYSNFNEYMDNLDDFMARYGYQLPEYTPGSNMVSYEFLVKAGQELAKQVKGSELEKALSAPLPQPTW